MFMVITIHMQFSMDDLLVELPSPPTQGATSELDCYYPPRLNYAVRAPAEQLDCTIQIRGAVDANDDNGEEIFFNLRSTTALCSYVRKGELLSLELIIIFRESYIYLDR